MTTASEVFLLDNLQDHSQDAKVLRVLKILLNIEVRQVWISNYLKSR
jgi:hypothetical protein